MSLSTGGECNPIMRSQEIPGTQEGPHLTVRPFFSDSDGLPPVS
jgi:hypothetical protein